MNIDALVRKGVKDVQPYVPGKPIEEVQRERKLRRVIKLASNENALGPSKKALAAVRHGLRDLHRYPDGSGFYLKQKLAQAHQLPAESIVLGNGSDELFVLALRAFVNEGDEVVVAKPTFLMYEIAAKLAHARVVTVPLTHGLRYDLMAMRSVVSHKTKLIFVANPDNPTGTYVTADEVRTFMTGLPPHVIVVFDEAYFEYVEATDFPDMKPYLHTHHLLITRTFSKAYGLAGLRVGYGLAKPELAMWLERVREPFNVNTLAQRAAVAALDDAAHVQRTRALARDGRQLLLKHGERLGMKCVPSQTNFVLMEVGPWAADVVEQLLARGIIVRDMRAWGLDRYLRVTIGLPRENQMFIRELKRILRTLT